MSDITLQTLKRQALATKDVVDEVAYLIAKFRVMPAGSTDAAASCINTAVGTCHSAPNVTISDADVKDCLYEVAGCNCGTTGEMCNTYCDTYSWCIVSLKNGKYAYASESSDTSGHG